MSLIQESSTLLKNIKLLVTFECAARNNSYSLAAADLCISQAAVSQQMRKLELSLNTLLFIRKGRKMLLSQQGKLLLDSVQKALGIINKGIRKIRNEEIINELSISSTQAFSTLWLMPRLKYFSELYPEIQIRIISSSGFENLEQSYIDLAIRFGFEVEKHISADLACEYFGEAKVYPICSARLAKKLILNSPTKLNSTWLVALETPGFYDWKSWFKHTGTTGYNEHQKWTKVSTTDMALNAIINEHGVTLAVPYLCQDKLDSGELIIPFELPHHG